MEKTIEFNRYKKAVVNSNIVLSFVYLSCPYISGRKSDHYVIEDFTTGTSDGAIRGLNSLCVVVVSCRLIK